jgi:CheY-like chemotaxis protein
LKHNNVYQLIQKGDIHKSQLLEVVSRMLFSKESIPNQPHESIVERKNSSSPVILVVEDNPDNMITIKALLQGYGEVLEATNGLDAMELALKSIPDLILLDIALPEMNGPDLLKELRQIEKLQLIPVLAVTASAMKGDKEQFMALGFNNYISKPIDHLLFKEIITEALGNKSSTS